MLRRLDREWRDLPDVSLEDDRPSQVGVPDIHIDVHQDQRSRSLAPQSRRHWAWDVLAPVLAAVASASATYWLAHRGPEIRITPLPDAGVTQPAEVRP